LMLQFAPGVKVYLACKPVDMRRGFDGLAADVAQTLRADPYSGAAFVFRSKRGDYVKILTWDGSGLCLFAKRLEKGRFVWPPIVEGALHLTSAQLAMLWEGIDWRRPDWGAPPARVGSHPPRSDRPSRGQCLAQSQSRGLERRQRHARAARAIG